MKRINLSVIVLAAGKGTRMGAGKPKVLRELDGKPLIFWTLNLLKNIEVEDVTVIVGHESKSISKVIANFGFHPHFKKQKQLLGTGHAVKLAINNMKNSHQTVLVLFGDDSSLYEHLTLRDFIKYHVASKSKATFLVSEQLEPTDIGGVLLDKGKHPIQIVSKAEMIAKGITKHNTLCGAFCFNVDWLKTRIKEIKKNETSGEYPLPGLITVAKKHNEKINTFFLENKKEWASINTLEELNHANLIKKGFYDN